MKTLLHRAESRGFADHGWLKARHTFSFGDYFDSTRIHFGKLRVLNDDLIAPGRGFEKHPHEDMEIVSIPLEGSLKHQDTLGNQYVIRSGEVQIMSAGTGIEHSEVNPSPTERTNLLQIWILTRQKGIPPRYEQKEFPVLDREGKFQLLVSPDGREGSLEIKQDAFFSLVRLREKQEMDYRLYMPQNGVYIFLISGELQLGELMLQRRDGVGIYEAGEFHLSALKDSEVLLIEVPV